VASEGERVALPQANLKATLQIPVSSWRRPALIGLPCVAAVALPLVLWPHSPAPGAAQIPPPQQVVPKLTARPTIRLNQAPENYDKGLAIDSDFALLKGSKDKIAFLTFDDGPSPVTKRVLATLEKNHIKATFFIVGQMAVRYPEMLKKEYEAGHAIANHSYTHIYPKVYHTQWTMIDEINQTEAVLEKVLGPTFHTRLFRFPGGYMGERSVFHHHKQLYASTLHDCGMHFIDWNVDCGDTMPKTQSAGQLVSRVLSEASGQNRIVVLMHDAGAKDRTADALPRIIAGLKKRGYVFRTLD
jgi:peptidoglycan/xylan/chitin deacetylase (PgdA/CDA1 family)